MRKVLILAVIAAIGSAVAAVAADGAKLGASAWSIGPVIRGKNYSVGMPPHPSPASSGWYFEFPYPSVEAGHVHYLTFPHGSLAGKKEIVMRYRIEAAPGVRFVPRETPELPGTMTMFFQRAGDNWSARGRYETYRWYAPVNTVVDLARGEHELKVDLDDGGWAAVMTSFARTNPEAFRDAKENAQQVGFVFGSRQGGYGHGVYATGRARFTLLSFQVR